MTISIDQQIACIKREIDYRQRVYPRLVIRGQMTMAKREYEMSAIAAVLATLEQVKHEAR